MGGRDTDLKETYGIITTSVTQRSSNRSYLESRFKINMYQDINNYVPIQQDVKR